MTMALDENQKFTCVSKRTLSTVIFWLQKSIFIDTHYSSLIYEFQRNKSQQKGLSSVVRSSLATCKLKK